MQSAVLAYLILLVQLKNYDEGKDRKTGVKKALVWSGLLLRGQSRHSNMLMPLFRFFLGAAV
jgi:hypothetical protein